MGQKKSSKLILILIILLIILIAIAGVAYTYFATDVFRTNKELFFKYIVQMVDEKEGFIEPKLKEYFEKQKNTPYLDEGGASVNITSTNEQRQFEKVNGMSITFDGQVDNVNTQFMQNISLNYSDSVKFPFAYKQIGDTIGVQTNYIGSKYIAIDKNKMQDLEDALTSENVSIGNLSGFEKLKELANVQLTNEDLQHIKDTYLNVLNQQFQDSSFSKIEEANNKGYRLTLSGEQLKSLIVKLLETLKNDQSTLDKLNEYIKIQKNSSKITATNIDNVIKEINNNSELNNKTLEITVYQTKGKTNRFFFKVNETELKLEKIVTGNDLQYNIEVQISDNNQLGKIGFITKIAGLQSMQNITENYELTLETEETKYQYNYNNNVEFTDSTNIEAFNSNNSMMLNEMNKEERDTLIDAVVKRIQNVNKNQMEKIGVEENENPLQYVIPSMLYDFVSYNGTTISEQEVSAFNKKFEMYESTNLQGVTVKGLFSTIQLNNEAQEDNNRKIKEIHFDGEEYEVTDQNITLLKSSVETQTPYRVSFERDEDTGIIYRAVINKK